MTQDPNVVRNEVARITGVDLMGLIQKGPIPGTFIIRHKNGYVICRYEPDGLEVRGYNARNEHLETWDTTPQAESPGAAEFLRQILKLAETPVFKSRHREEKPDISRVSYTTQLGPVLVHTRRTDNRTAIVIEIVKTKKILQMFQERTTGAINMDDIVQLPQVPF